MNKEAEIPDPSNGDEDILLLPTQKEYGGELNWLHHGIA